MRRKHVYRNPGFEDLVGRYYDELLRRNPLLATTLGEHRYDGLLPNIGAEAMAKDIDFWREMRDRFEALGERELSLDERLDRRVVLHLLQKELFIHEDLQRWKFGRDLAMDIGDSLFLLFARDFAPLSLRVESMISRMKVAPVYFHSGRTLFQTVPQLWGELYLESAARLPELIDTIAASLKGNVPDFLGLAFAKAGKELKKALQQHVQWLKHAVLPKAQTDWALGSGAFHALMGLRRFGMTIPEMLEISEHHLRKAQDRMASLATNLVASGHLQAATQRVRSKTPKTFEMAMDAYRDAVARSRAFVELKEFATLPGDETLEIMETPAYLSHLIPFAAYLNPERTAHPQKGIYLVTRPPGESDLSRHCYADISNTSVHEGYPGHHLHYSCQNLHPSKVRILSESIETIEGWAHYCEEETKKLGFEDSEENVFIQSMDEVLRAARVMIDINIQQKSWTYAQGLEFLVTKADMDRQAAEAEMRRYTQTPGYPLSYLIGKVLICQLKDDLKKTFGSDLKDRDFHDLVIYEGSIPLFLCREYYPLMLKEMFQQKSGRAGA